MRTTFVSTFARIAALAWVLFAADGARAYSEIPDYPGEGGVATADTHVDGAPIRERLAAHESRIGANYAVLFVTYSDRDNRAGPRYGDEDQVFIESVVERWMPRANPASSVFIVVSTSNRDIIVHPGSSYTVLGWEGQDVKATIDGSDFGTYARSGDYAQAVMALVDAIEREVGRRISERETNRAYAQTVLGDVQMAIERFEAEAARTDVDVTRGRALVTDLETRSAALRATLADPTHRVDLHELGDLRDRIAPLAEYFGRSRGQLDEIREEIARLTEQRRRIVADPIYRSSDRAQQRVAEFDRSLVILRRALVTRNPTEAWDERGRAEATLLFAENDLASERSSFLWTRRILPFLVLGGLAIVLVRAARDRRRIVRGLLDQARTRLEALDTALGHASGKLVALENEHAVFLAGGTTPTQFVGASAEPVRRAAQSVDALFLAFEAATRIAAEARARIRAASPISIDAAQRALAALTTEAFVVRTEQVVGRKLLLPDEREIRETVPSLLVTLESAFARASEQLESLGARIGAIHERIERAGESFATVAREFAAASTRASVGRASARVAELEAERLGIVEASRLDPLGAEARVEAFEAEIEALRARSDAADRASAWAIVEHPRRAAEIAARVAACRSAGVRLLEEGFDPDGLLERAALRSREIPKLLARGEFAEALERADDAQRTLDELARSIDATERVRAEYPVRVPGEHARIAALRERLPERSAKIASLRSAYTPASLGDVADNVDEATRALDEAEARLGVAARRLGDTEQRYLAAACDVDRVALDVTAVHELFDAIDHADEDLAGDVRETALDLELVRRLLAEIDQDLAAIRVAGGEASGAGAGLAEQATAIDAKLALRPVAIGEVAAETDALLARVRAEAARTARVRADYAALEELRGVVVAAASSLREKLEASTDDRPLANERLAAARSRLARVPASVPAAEVESSLAELRSIAREVEAVRELARTDVDQANRARATLAEAHDALRQAEAQVPIARAWELGVARTQVRDAQAALASQQYAEALASARLAEESTQDLVREIRRAEKEAADAARRLRDEAEADARRERDRRSGRTHTSSSSGLFGSSGSSWGSSSSSSGHSHRSSGSSHRSSSGGSSYGSSSGGSKIGSSSGSSKW